MLIDKSNKKISLNRQLVLVGLNKSSYYYEGKGESAENIRLMNIIDQINTDIPFYGYRKITKELERKYHINVNKKRVQRLMQVMGISAIYPKQNLSKSRAEHKKYPYLLKGLEIVRPNHVWGSDITYIRLKGGYAYLVAILDWYSRYVVSWELSTSLGVRFCLNSVESGLQIGKPEIHNVDQGSQFTCDEYTGLLERHGVLISMDGRGRCMDNIFTERLWRSLKYEDIYINNYETVQEAREGISEYIDFYNNRRVHEALDYKIPADVYFG